jgi:hypothetical protein
MAWHSPVQENVNDLGHRVDVRRMSPGLLVARLAAPLIDGVCADHFVRTNETQPGA